MVTLDLNHYLSSHVYGFVMIFARMGSALMLFPGIGESFVPVRSRLLLALAVSFVLLPPLTPRFPTLPESPSMLVALIVFETVIGLYYGTLIRVLLSALETTGTIIAMQIGLSNATIFNPTQASQSPLPSALLGMMAIVLIFATGLDHMLLGTVLKTYDLFPPGSGLMLGDMSALLSHTINKSFVLGIELSMPFLVVGTLLYVSIGLMQKVMPSIQLFMISMPLQIWGGLFVFSVTLAIIMTVWIKAMDRAVGSFFTQ